MDQFAIVGMSCLFPGASTPEMFWHNLMQGVDCRSTGAANLQRLADDPTADAQHPIGWTLGGWVDDTQLDLGVAGLPAERVRALDPVYRWSLYVAQQALRDAGIADAARARTGLIMGNYTFPTLRSSALTVPRIHRQVVDGLTDAGWPVHPQAGAPMPTVEDLGVGGLPVRFAADALQLRGPQLGLDAACASALYALQLACLALSTGDADAMLAGGVCAPDPTLIHLSFSDLHAYPTNGVSQPFDASSTGITTGQGAALVVVKRLADAVAAGDEVHAVIEGIGWAADGNGRHLLAPNHMGQRRAYDDAYRAAGLEPAGVDYVECHATGTPLGDNTELDTLADLFGTSDHPLIGSVKGNVGHLLTVAGATSLIKTVMALREGVIPPTRGVTQALAKARPHLVTEATPWPGNAPTRRAAVSAFGFGGTNAHVVLSRSTHPELTQPATAPTPPVRGVGDVIPVSITGMAAHVGDLRSLDDYEDALYSGASNRRALPAARWFGFDGGSGPVPTGAYVESLELDGVRYQIPPNELSQFNPQHLLMLKVAQEALQDSGLVEAESGIGTRHPARRVAVLLAMDMEPRTHAHRARVDVHDALEAALGTPPDDGLRAAARASVHEPISPNEVLSYISNLVASRISARWNFTGPSFTIAADTTGGAQAISTALDLLRSDPSIEAVLVGAVDLAGGPETVGAALSEAGIEPTWAPGDGAGALLLQRTTELGAGTRRYAELAGVGIDHTAPFLGGPDDVARAVRNAAQRALDLARLDPSRVEVLRAHQVGRPNDAGERAGLDAVYGPAAGGGIAWGRTSRLAGDCGHASAVIGVIEAVLSCHHAYLPATDDGALPDGDTFCAPRQSIPWLREDPARDRVAAVSVTGSRGSAAHLLVRAATSVGSSRSVMWSERGPLLLVLSGATLDAIADQAREVADQLADADDLAARQLCWVTAGRVRSAITAAVVSADAAQLRQELQRLAGALPALLEGSIREWSTPNGSYLTLEPLGPEGKVAFVYPGAFTAYPGVGAELFRLFPGLIERLEADNSNPVEALRARTVWPRRRTAMTPSEQMAHEEGMLHDIPGMLAIGTTVAMLGTDALRDFCGVPVHGAMGYSLGEASMLFALGAWDRRARGDELLTSASAFKDGLCGRRDSVRTAWGLHPATPDEDVWSSRIVLGDAERVLERVASSPRVWVTHVNTPSEVVVAGDPTQVDEVIADLGMPTARPPADPVMHCAAVEPDLAELAALNHFPVKAPGAVTMITAAGYRPIDDFDSDVLSRDIADTLRCCVDWPRLAGLAHRSGFRYFIEVGPGATCTRWVEESLADQPHLAVSLDRRGQRRGAGVARILARLISHGVQLDLRRLLGDEPVRARSLARTITLGAPSPRVVMARSVAALPIPSAAPAPSTARPVMSEIPKPPSPITPLPEHGTPPWAGDPRGAQPAADGEQVTPELSPLPALAGPGTGVVETTPPRRGFVDTAPQRATAMAPRAEWIIDHRGAPADDALVAAITRVGATPRRPDVIFDEAELLEFATGSVGAVFGPAFAEVDTMSRRVRLPEPPYLFATRVTQLDATTGTFEPSSITTEYDVPADPWYALDGMVPAAVTIEAGQCDLLLISYLGIDLRNQGHRVYRLLDSTLAFHGDLPQVGQTLRYEISIDRFVDTGKTLIFFFSYRCYADDSLILELSDACAGFFTDEELHASRGIVPSILDKRRTAALEQKTFKPLLQTTTTTLTGADLQALSDGRVADVFGPHYDQQGLNPSLRLPGDMLRMVDAVTSMDRTGGPCGIGHLSAIKELDPDGWYFTCHFTGDPVLPGSLVAEGGVQLLQTYALSLGLQQCLPDARFQTVPGLETKVRVRGQIVPQTPNLRYEADIIDVTLLPRPTIIADITVYDGDRAVVSMQNFGVQLREKPGTDYRAGIGGVTTDLGRRNAAGDTAVINEMHLAHAAKGDLGTAMGPEFDIYRDRRAPHIPNGDFQFVDRIMSLDGVRGELRAGASMVTEYDSPADAWYYRDNAAPVAPNCLIMETSLQSAILLGYYLGATLEHPDLELGIRNLDGKATWHRSVDLRDRTIRQESRMSSSTSFGGTVLQSFTYELYADDELFYSGSSMFGYFTDEGLSEQLGLDNGTYRPTWLESNAPDSGVRTISPAESPDLYLDAAGGSMRMPDGQLRLLDTLDIVDGGGEHGRGYLHGRRAVTPDDWYFTCHFHRDPVMPGSLGVEAILQAIQLYAMDGDLLDGLQDPFFEPATDVQTSWSYRGQILRSDPELTFEVHIKEVVREADRVVVIADASLYKPGLRIYALTDIAVQARSRTTGPRTVTGPSGASS